MQCKCGGDTKDHDVERSKALVAQYRRCIPCGFVLWLWNAPEWPRERFVREDESPQQALLL